METESLISASDLDEDQDVSMRFVSPVEKKGRHSIRYHDLNIRSLKAMAAFESQDTYIYTDQLYDEMQSQHINEKNIIAKRGWLKWALVLLIAFVVAVVAFLAYIASEELVHLKLGVLASFVSRKTDEDPIPSNLNIFYGYLSYTGFCLLFTTLSCGIVQFMGPHATGSGVPEVIGYLNGIRVSGCWNIPSFIAKVLSMIFTVASGLMASVEGPTIHYSAMVGASVSKIKLKALAGMRNDREKRDFMTTGTAVGVAAAFRSPIGGLLLALEETATYWDASLCWRTFLGCMTASFLVIVGRLILKGEADTFNPLSNLTYQVAGAIHFQWWEIPIFLVIGSLTGALGGAFIRLNQLINERRLRAYASFPTGQNWFSRLVKRFPRIFRVIEACAVSFITVTLGFLIALLLPCSKIIEPEAVEGINERLVQFTCPSGYYNEMASLMVNAYDNSIALLYNSETAFTIPVLIPGAIIIFFCANLAAGLGISGGMVQPMFLVGGIWGRLIGNIIHSFVPETTPGLYALIGSAGFIGGLTRNTISFTVILIEVSGKLYLLLPIMASMMIGKFIGDRISHESFYHMNMHLKNYPFLESSASRITRLLVAKQVMAPNPKTVKELVRVQDVVDMLLTCPHNGFPVVDDQGSLVGLILRRHLLLLLQYRFYAPVPAGFMVADAPFVHLLIENVKRIRDTEKICNSVSTADYEEIIDLRPFYNKTVITVTPTSRVYYVHDLIRSLSLRHVVVVDAKQKVIGMITRKDLLQWSLKHAIDGNRFNWNYLLEPGKVVG